MKKKENWIKLSLWPHVAGSVGSVAGAAVGSFPFLINILTALTRSQFYYICFYRNKSTSKTFWKCRYYGPSDITLNRSGPDPTFTHLSD